METITGERRGRGVDPSEETNTAAAKKTMETFRSVVSRVREARREAVAPAERDVIEEAGGREDSERVRGRGSDRRAEPLGRQKLAALGELRRQRGERRDREAQRRRGRHDASRERPAVVAVVARRLDGYPKDR